MKIVQDYVEPKTTDVIEVTSAGYVGDYILKISFNDGTEKFVDFGLFLTKSLHPSISKYLDQSLFEDFKIVDGNLNWNDYDLIFPVHDLYEGIIN